MRRLIGFFLGLAALFIPVAPSWAAPSLAGNWFGQGQPANKDSMYLDHLTGDGKIHSLFRDCRDGRAYDSTADGTWSASGNIMTVKTTLRNGVSAPRTDTYRLVSVTADELKEILLSLNFLFDERRVADDFTMPSCQR